MNKTYERKKKLENILKDELYLVEYNYMLKLDKKYLVERYFLDMHDKIRSSIIFLCLFIISLFLNIIMYSIIMS